MFTKEAVGLAKKCYEAIPIIAKAVGKEWKWSPKMGELILETGTAQSIDVISDVMLKNKKWWIETLGNWWPLDKDVIPILHWETLEEILKGLEFFMSEPKRSTDTNQFRVGFSKFTYEQGQYSKSVYIGEGKNRQEAVTRSIIELARRLVEEVKK